MDYLIRGDDYLAKSPNFKLVGPRGGAVAADLGPGPEQVQLGAAGRARRASAARRSAWGCEASKKAPDAPFDIVSKRIFWLDTDGLFSQGDPVKVNESFQRIIKRLYRTPESILIIEDTQRLHRGLRATTARCISSTRWRWPSRRNKTQAILEARDEDLDVILKAHSDIRDLFTLIDLEEPVGDALFKIVEDARRPLQAFHRIQIAPDAINGRDRAHHQIPLARWRHRTRAQPERSTTLIDRAFSTYRLTAHRTAPGLGQAEAAAEGGDATARKAAAEAELRSPWCERLGQEAAADQDALQAAARRRDPRSRKLEAELERAAEGGGRGAAKSGADVAEEVRASGRIASFARLATGGGLRSEAVRGINEKIRNFQAEIAKNKTAFEALTRELNNHLELTRDIVLQEFADISGISVEQAQRERAGEAAQSRSRR